MILSDKNKAPLYALLIFIPTLFFGNEKYYLTLPLFLLLVDYKTIIERFKSFTKREFIYYIMLPLTFIVLATVNKLVNGAKICSVKDYYASFYLFLILILTAYFIKHLKIFNYLLYFICVEIGVCMVEYFFHTRTFFIEIPISNIIADKTILYDSHVYGLSINSSIIALKILTGVLIIEFVKLPTYLKLILRIILMLGIIVTFNRAVILSIFFFWFLLFIRTLIKEGFTINLGKKIFNTFIIFYFVFKLFSHESFLYQFTRGESGDNVGIASATLKTKKIKNAQEKCTDSKTQTLKNITAFNQHKPRNQEGALTSLFLANLPNINTSGRTLIWLNYLDFIDHHLLFGNGSDKFLVKNINPETSEVSFIHAHNSYLEQLATHGLLLTLFFFVILFFLWKKNNWILIVSILFYSMFQYGIFWGFSYLDLFFMLFLISDKDFLEDGNT